MTSASVGEFAVPLPAALRVAAGFPFVGREREVDALARAAAATADGVRRVVLIGGEAGAGKTRLAFEFARGRHAQGAVVLLGACDAELGLPYEPWAQALAHLVDAMPPDVAATRAQLLARLAPLLPRIEAKMPGLRAPAPADAVTERHRLYHAVDGLLSATGADRELVIVLDDLHRASSASLALLRSLAGSDSGGRLLLIGTFRDSVDAADAPSAATLADLRRVDNVDWLRAGPLDAAAIEQFVAKATGGDLDPSQHTLAAQLDRRCRGNAFYLCQLWRHLQTLDRGDWSLSDVALAVPDGVRDVVGARLAQLSETASAVADLAAVSGPGIDSRVLRAAFSGTSLAAALDELMRSGLLVELAGPPSVYRFTHDLVRDAVAQRRSAAGRAELHRRLAAAIEVVYRADLRPVLAELAAHYVSAAAAAGDVEPAITYCKLAAAQAMSANAEEDAIIHLESARALTAPGTPEHVRLLLDLALCRTRAGFDPAALDLYRAASLSAAEQGLESETTNAVLGLADALSMHGQADPAVAEQLLRAAARVDDQDLPLFARLRTGAAFQLAVLGRRDEARNLVRETLEIVRRAGSRPAELAALHFDTAWGDYDEQLAAAIRGVGLAEELGEVWHSCNFAGGVARAHIRRGELNQARPWLDRLRGVADGNGYGIWRYHVACYDSMFALAAGSFTEAEQLAEAATSLLPAGAEFTDGVYGMQMYAIQRERGRLAQLAPMLRFAAAHAEGWWRPGLAALYAHAGLLDEARQIFEALSADNFAAVPRDAMWPACLVFLSEVCLAIGDLTRAEFLLDELSPHAGRTLGAPFTTCFGPADRLRGALAVLLDRRNEGRAHFAAALDLADRSGSPVWQARTQHDWALALHERSDLLQHAYATAKTLGMADLATSAAAALADGTIHEPTTAPKPPHVLTTRELDVVRLVAAGRSNHAISSELYLSPHTVAHHVRSILRKTGSATRAEAAAWAVRSGLLQ